MAKDFEYFGVSPANDVSLKEKVKWLKKVFFRIKATRKTHGFGATANTLIKQFPFYSVDSTSWKAGGLFARIPTFKNSKSGSINFKDKNNFDNELHNILIGMGMSEQAALELKRDIVLADRNKDLEKAKRLTEMLDTLKETLA